MSDQIQTFENQAIRTAWDEEKEEWYFSIVDVIGVLTDQPDTRHAAKYWSVMKTRMKKEGAQLLRIIQSVPSPKAEPFKLWLAEVGRDRIEEAIDPEKSIDRALETYVRKGYSREWINQRP